MERHRTVSHHPVLKPPVRGDDGLWYVNGKQVPEDYYDSLRDCLAAIDDKGELQAANMEPANEIDWTVKWIPWTVGEAVKNMGPGDKDRILALETKCPGGKINSVILSRAEWEQEAMTRMANWIKDDPDMETPLTKSWRVTMSLRWNDSNWQRKLSPTKCHTMLMAAYMKANRLVFDDNLVQHIIAMGHKQGQPLSNTVPQAWAVKPDTKLIDNLAGMRDQNKDTLEIYARLAKAAAEGMSTNPDRGFMTHLGWRILPYPTPDLEGVATPARPGSTTTSEVAPRASSVVTDVTTTAPSETKLAAGDKKVPANPHPTRSTATSPERDLTMAQALGQFWKWDTPELDFDNSPTVMEIQEIRENCDTPKEYEDEYADIEIPDLVDKAAVAARSVMALKNIPVDGSLATFIRHKTTEFRECLFTAVARAERDGKAEQTRKAEALAREAQLALDAEKARLAEQEKLANQGGMGHQHDSDGEGGELRAEMVREAAEKRAVVLGKRKWNEDTGADGARGLGLPDQHFTTHNLPKLLERFARHAGMTDDAVNDAVGTFLRSDTETAAATPMLDFQISFVLNKMNDMMTQANQTASRVDNLHLRMSLAENAGSQRQDELVALKAKVDRLTEDDGDPMEG